MLYGAIRLQSSFFPLAVIFFNTSAALCHKEYEFSIIPSIPDNSESNLVTGIESNYINYTEIAHLIGNGLVC